MIQHSIECTVLPEDQVPYPAPTPGNSQPTCNSSYMKSKDL